jgi:hypothetical protein
MIAGRGARRTLHVFAQVHVQLSPDRGRCSKRWTAAGTRRAENNATGNPCAADREWLFALRILVVRGRPLAIAPESKAQAARICLGQALSALWERVGLAHPSAHNPSRRYPRVSVPEGGSVGPGDPVPEFVSRTPRTSRERNARVALFQSTCAVAMSDAVRAARHGS